MLVTVVDAGDRPSTLPDCDLVIDAAYGTGFHGDHEAPAVRRGTPVLAVDIPSGVDGLTGEAGPGVLAADRTVTFAALKPGLLLEPGASLAGRVEVADIGLDASSATTWALEESDVRGWLPDRDPTTHKWRAAVWVVAGSPGMDGAAALVAAGAQRVGSGYVRLSTPGGGVAPAPHVPVEVVRTPLPASGWAPTVVEGLDRFAALVVGNGLGTSDEIVAQVRRLVASTGSPGEADGDLTTVVVDADGLTALGTTADALVGRHVVLTPHDGEFSRLAGRAPGPDRIAAARDLAGGLGCVVLLKGGPTVVAGPDGSVLVVTTGDARLATAGTGDVLAGIIGGLAASGLEPVRAAAAGAFLHGLAGDLGWRHGLVAGDLAPLLPAVLDRLGAASTTPDRPGT